MASPIDASRPLVPAAATVTDVVAAPAAKTAAPLLQPDPPSAVMAVSSVPLPPPGADQPTPAGVDALLALEDRLGEPTGEKVADAFAHDWIAELAQR